MKVGDLVKFKRPTKKEAGKVHLVLGIDRGSLPGTNVVHIDGIPHRRSRYLSTDLEVAQKGVN
jgi:hypothetical protein